MATTATFIGTYMLELVSLGCGADMFQLGGCSITSRPRAVDAKHGHENGSNLMPELPRRDVPLSVISKIRCKFN